MTEISKSKSKRDEAKAQIRTLRQVDGQMGKKTGEGRRAAKGRAVLRFSGKKRKRERGREKIRTG